MSELTQNGADGADLYFQHTRRNDLTLEDGIVSSADSAIERGVGLRVVVGEQTGYAFTEDLTLASMLAADKGPTIRTTMLVDARAAGSLVSRLLRPANARSVQQGRSFWADLAGRRAFSERLTIVDDPLIRRGLASRTYDDEGIAARVLPVGAVAGVRRRGLLRRLKENVLRRRGRRPAAAPRR